MSTRVECGPAELGYLKNDNSADVSVLLSFNARVLNQPEVIRFINNCLRNHLCLCTFFAMILHLAVAHDLAGRGRPWCADPLGGREKAATVGSALSSLCPQFLDDGVEDCWD